MIVVSPQGTTVEIPDEPTDPGTDVKQVGGVLPGDVVPFGAEVFRVLSVSSTPSGTMLRMTRLHPEPAYTDRYRFTPDVTFRILP